MKNKFSLLFLSVAFLSLVSGSSACAGVKGNKVATQPELRNFLLEEFTAIHCSYCPQAHEISKNLHAVFGKRMNTIAVHVSSLASPGTNEIDFRTEFGEQWFARLGTGGVPSGSINRFHFDGYCAEGSYDINRSLWSQVIRSIMNDTAEVNLYAEANLDKESRKLTVKVEMFYPKAVKDEFNTITVALTENFVRGTQSGGGASDKYLHQHALRDLLTDVWGDTVADLEEGVVIEKSFETQIPETYQGTAPDLSHLEVVVFVSNPKGEIMNSTSCQVLFPERKVAPSAELRVTGISKYYSRTAIPVRVMNLGTDTLRTIKLSVDWGKEKYEPETSGLSIPYGHEEEVWFELGEYPFSQVMKYRIVTKEINGEPFESNLVSDHSFWPYKINTDSVQIVVKTTAKASDLSWTVRTRNGEIVHQSEPYVDGEVQEDILVLPLEKGTVYSFEINDAFLDGFSGGYSITDMDGKVIEKVDYIGSYGDKVSFTRAEETSNEVGEDMVKLEMLAIPNPVGQGQDVRISFSKPLPQDVRLEIFDITGNSRMRQLVPSGSVGIDWNTKGLASGLYIVRLNLATEFQLMKILVR